MVRMIKGKKIGFDLDGVLYDFVGPFDDLLRDNGYTVVESDYGRGIERAEVIKMMDKMGKTRPFLWLPKYVENFRAAIELAKENEITVITYRDWYEGGEIDTLRRLAEDGLVASNVIFSGKKGEYCKRLDLDYFIEDVRANAIDAAANVTEGVFLVNRPYNVGDVPEKVKRINSVEELLKY